MKALIQFNPTQPLRLLAVLPLTGRVAEPPRLAVHFRFHGRGGSRGQFTIAERATKPHDTLLSQPIGGWAGWVLVLCAFPTTLVSDYHRYPRRHIPAYIHPAQPPTATVTIPPANTTYVSVRFLESHGRVYTLQHSPYHRKSYRQ